MNRYKQRKAGELIGGPGFHLPTRCWGQLPNDPPLPSFVRVLPQGVVIDDWFIAFPLTQSKMRWLIYACSCWAPVVDSDETRKWITDILDAIEAACLRFSAQNK